MISPSPGSEVMIEANASTWAWTAAIHAPGAVNRPRLKPVILTWPNVPEAVATSRHRKIPVAV